MPDVRWRFGASGDPERGGRNGSRQLAVHLSATVHHYGSDIIMSVRYIGSKARVIDKLLACVGSPRGVDGAFVDAFCGTGVVAEAAARAGWAIRLNDHLVSAVTMARARLISGRDISFRAFGGYERALSKLSVADPVPGFLWREYSPASMKHTGVARRYFTEANATRIDGIRLRIAAWRAGGEIRPTEERLLLADLLLAVNSVANIAGTYGCFLSYWSTQSQMPLALRPRTLFPHRVKVQASVSDVADVQVTPQDLVYFDPPYTKRQYAAYYHILETITVGDEPSVSGITGLRPWRHKASDFCYRTRALRAIVELVGKQVARRVLVSYSDEGHVALPLLFRELSQIGDVTVVPLKTVTRYRPSRAAADRGSAVTEYVLIVNRSAEIVRKKAVA